MEALKLAIEMVPNPLFGISLYRLAPPSRWRKLRAEVLGQQGLTCAVCQRAFEKSADLQAHEAWAYEEGPVENVARLTGVHLICKACHAVEHFGNTVRRVGEGGLSADYIPILIKHFCDVNGVDEEAFQNHLNEASALHTRRSTLNWVADFGPFVELFPLVDGPDG